MNLPESIMMTPSLFGDGLDGAAHQQSRNDQYGIQVDAFRSNRRTLFTEAWTSDSLPGKEFPTYRELREVLITATMFVFEPVIIKVELREPKSTGNCYLCRGVWTRSVRAKIGWRVTDEISVPSCEACLEKTKENPLAAQEARRKWVREHPINLTDKVPPSVDDNCPF